MHLTCPPKTLLGRVQDAIDHRSGFEKLKKSTEMLLIVHYFCKKKKSKRLQSKNTRGKTILPSVVAILQTYLLLWGNDFHNNDSNNNNMKQSREICNRNNKTATNKNGARHRNAGVYSEIGTAFIASDQSIGMQSITNDTSRNEYVFDWYWSQVCAVCHHSFGLSFCQFSIASIILIQKLAVKMQT